MWRLSHETLSQQGISYKIPAKIRGGGFGKITSGNGGPALRGATELGLALADLDKEKSCLLSSEHFFTQISESEDLSFISDVSSKLGFEKVKLLLFVRDPVGLMSSLYDQALKRAGGAMTIGEFYDDPTVVVTPAKTLAVIEKLDALEGADLEILNYSANKKRILEVSSEWLAIDHSRFKRPTVQTVNRSLSSGERELLRQLNRVKARSATDFANDLCENLPLISSDQMIPSEEVQKKFLRDNEAQFSSIQQRLPKDQQLSLDAAPAPESKKYEFTGEQLSELVSYLVRYQKKKGFLASKVTSFRRRFGA